jgi:RNA polymerase sigma-70 factor (ECF subfamily)
MEQAVRTPTTDRSWHDDQTTAGATKASAIPNETVGGRDIAIFEKLVGQCEDKAYRLAMQLVRSELVAQEILQQTFLSAWQNMQRFAGVIQFSDWVYRTVGKAALGHLDSTRKHGEKTAGEHLPAIRTSPRFWLRASVDDDSDWSTRPADHLCSEALYCHIRKTVDALPDELRTVFILCDSEGLSVEIGAEILDLPVATAKENLQVARLMVRDAIGHYFSRVVHDRAGASAHTDIEHHLLSEASFTDP